MLKWSKIGQIDYWCLSSPFVLLSQCIILGLKSTCSNTSQQARIITLCPAAAAQRQQSVFIKSCLLATRFHALHSFFPVAGQVKRVLWWFPPLVEASLCQCFYTFIYRLETYRVWWCSAWKCPLRVLSLLHQSRVRARHTFHSFSLPPCFLTPTPPFIISLSIMSSNICALRVIIINHIFPPAGLSHYQQRVLQAHRCECDCRYLTLS